MTTTTIKASAESIFAVLADSARHAAIDGTGWVREPLDREPICASGQLFRMAMYHPNHRNGDYEMVNRVEVYDPPRAILDRLRPAPSRPFTRSSRELEFGRTSQPAASKHGPRRRALPWPAVLRHVVRGAPATRTTGTTTGPVDHQTLLEYSEALAGTHAASRQ